MRTMEQVRYTPEIAEAICNALSKSGSLRAVCRMEGMPDRSTVMRWVVDDIDGFAAKYARAKDLGVDEFAEETLDIGDEPPVIAPDGKVDSGAVAHSKIRIETRRWLTAILSAQ